MTLKSEIGNGYLDRDGLVTPNRNGGSNNGVMYSGEYIWLLLKNGELRAATAVNLLTTLDKCFREPGLLLRHPDGSGGQQGPDDYLGVCLAGKALDALPFEPPVRFGNAILWYGLRHLGFFRTAPEASFWSTFLWRQLQLVAAAFACASWHPLVRPLAWLVSRPFMWYAAASIFFACRGKVDGTDPWRLSWILVKLTQDKSLLCALAGRGWYDRLGQAFGSDGMQGVAKVYYEAEHPFSRWHEFGRGVYPKGEQ